jgi:hypothetical protein
MQRKWYAGRPRLLGHLNRPSWADLYTFAISADKKEAIGNRVTL